MAEKSGRCVAIRTVWNFGPGVGLGVCLGRPALFSPSGVLCEFVCLGSAALSVADGSPTICFTKRCSGLGDPREAALASLVIEFQPTYWMHRSSWLSGALGAAALRTYLGGRCLWRSWFGFDEAELSSHGSSMKMGCDSQTTGSAPRYLMLDFVRICPSGWFAIWSPNARR